MGRIDPMKESSSCAPEKGVGVGVGVGVGLGLGSGVGLGLGLGLEERSSCIPEAASSEKGTRDVAAAASSVAAEV